MKFTDESEGLPLAGLRIAPAQVFGAVRLVPLLRDHVVGDLRLGLRPFAEPPAMVGLRGDVQAPDLAYFGYIPHAMVVRWSDDGQPLAAHGGQLAARKQAPAPKAAKIVHRMARREEPNALRFLPLHLAMEGFLSLHFGGPDVAWSEYSREALARGLSPRSERVVPGAYIAGLDDALRMFEIHHGQVGVLLFVADALAALVCVPHPDDYRAIHRSLIRDFFGELVFHYGRYYDEVQEHRVRLAGPVEGLADLRRGLGEARAAWAEFTATMAAGVLRERLRWHTVHRAGPFRLRRFIAALRPDEENHIGEAIVRDSGELEYCKTFRLSAAQVRRAFLLEQLAAHDWSLARAAQALGCDVPALQVRLRNAGFGYLLKEHVLAALPP